jgi:hypothetical protein
LPASVLAPASALCSSDRARERSYRNYDRRIITDVRLSKVSNFLCNEGFRNDGEILKLHIIRYFLPLAVLSFAAVLNAQSVVELRLKRVPETIDAHAVTHHFEPPAKSSGTRWQVANIEGCTVELKETSHRESPNSVVTGDDVLSLSEDRVSLWTFDLANLLPQFIMPDSFGGPHVGIFA